MEIPKFHETFKPILEILSNGETIHTQELQRMVIEKYYSNLSDDLLTEKTKSGDILINNRINWGKSYLKKEDMFLFLQEGMSKSLIKA